MSVREAATEDIRQELAASQHSFIAFMKELDPVIDNLVKEYTDIQVSLNNKYKKTK